MKDSLYLCRSETTSYLDSLMVPWFLGPPFPSSHHEVPASSPPDVRVSRSAPPPLSLSRLSPSTSHRVFLILSYISVAGVISPTPCQPGHPSVNSSAATQLRSELVVNTSGCVLHRQGLMSQGWHSSPGNRISRSAPAEPHSKKWAFSSFGNHLAKHSKQEHFENILKYNE